MKLIFSMIAIACLSISANAKFERVKPEIEEQKQISKLIDRVNQNGECTVEGVPPFGEWDYISGETCRGKWKTAEDKGSNPRFVIEDSKCTNVILGLEKTKNYRGKISYVAKGDGSTRLYKLDQYKVANIPVNKQSMEGDATFYVALVSNDGSSCQLLKAKY